MHLAIKLTSWAKIVVFFFDERMTRPEWIYTAVVKTLLHVCCSVVICNYCMTYAQHGFQVPVCNWCNPIFEHDQLTININGLFTLNLPPLSIDKWSDTLSNADYIKSTGVTLTITKKSLLGISRNLFYNWCNQDDSSLRIPIEWNLCYLSQMWK